MPDSQIQIYLPDGSIKQLPAGSTAHDVALSISPRLAAAAVVARVRPAHPASHTPAQNAVPTPGDEKSEPGEQAMYAAPDASAERLVDLRAPLHEDVHLQLLTEKDPDALQVVRHSAAHVMATAVLELFPDARLGHGPATENGFFYDFYRPTPFTTDDLSEIELKMAEVVGRNEPFVREFAPREQGLADYRAENDFMKVHFIE